MKINFMTPHEESFVIVEAAESKHHAQMNIHEN